MRTGSYRRSAPVFSVALLMTLALLFAPLHSTLSNPPLARAGGADATHTTVPAATATTQPFRDVNPGDYFWEAVNWLYARGAAEGLPPGTHRFEPYSPATRAFLVKMIVIAKNLPLTTTGNYFKDVPSTNPYYRYIMAAFHNHIVVGYNSEADCGVGNAPCFKPDAGVTRGQAAKIIVSTMGWTLLNPATPYFRDVDHTSVFYRFIETARVHYLIGGYPCGTPEPCPGYYYRPNNPITRGQLAKVVYMATNRTTKPQK